MKNMFAYLIIFLICPAVNGTPILQIDHDGKLLGAKEVEVSGEKYDVMFKDGTCIEIFFGCENNSDILFNDFLSARAASEALLDDVLTGVYDFHPELTLGCERVASQCSIYTPYRVFSASGAVSSDVAVNIPATFPDRFSGGGVINDLDLSRLDQVTWASWSIASVPEPNVISLLLAGLAMLLVVRQTNYKKFRHADKLMLARC
jgi:hypothetical protein